MDAIFCKYGNGGESLSRPTAYEDEGHPARERPTGQVMAITLCVCHAGQTWVQTPPNRLRLLVA